MARDTSHVVMGEDSLRCLNCGEEYKVAMPCSLPMFSAMAKTFTKEHAHCQPTAAGRARLESRTPAEWRASWDTGISSVAIYEYMSNGRVPRDTEIPLDPSDFGRCYRLLKLAPDWRARLAELGERSNGWRPLVNAWAELERLYEAALAKGAGTATELYNLMQRLQGRA